MAVTPTVNYDRTGYIVKKSPKEKKWKPLYFAVNSKKKLLYYFEHELVLSCIRLVVTYDDMSCPAQSVKPKGIIDLSSTGVYDLHESFFGR